jgi:acetyl-CoA synthetase
VCRTFPDQGRFWDVIDKHQVNIFYTAPTAIRSLMGQPVMLSSPVLRAPSLRTLGSVGEPINPEAWEWYYNVVGDGTLPCGRYLVADGDRRTLITPLPGATT